MSYERMMVKTFMEAGGQYIAPKLEVTTDTQAGNLYMRLVEEEFTELKTAFEAGDMVGVADGAGDLVWVIHGLCLSLGIPFDAVIGEIGNSNMSKTVNGKLIKREDGKILKPDTYRPPDIKSILDEAKLGVNL